MAVQAEADSGEIGMERAQIIDIRSDVASFELKREIQNGLKPQGGQEKTLPTLLLYDETGLRLFEKITYLEEYYLTNAEIEVGV